jgi:hypothetical protein
MAGLYVTLGPATPARLDAVAARMRHGSEREEQFVGPISYVWLGYDALDRYGPAHDPATGVRVVTGGRLCWPMARWQAAERLPYTGGLANRVLLDEFLREGPDGITPYNGAAVVVIWDPRQQTVHVWTDQLGYHPAFVHRPGPHAADVFTTFPDALRADPAVSLRPDYVSMAEFLRAWRVTPPHTYYEGVRHAGAASHLEWGLASGQFHHKEYWRPFERDFFATQAEAGEALAAALQQAVRERTAVAERPVFFVSGGADSRVMLYGAADPTRICGINLYEQPTAESQISQALCERCGAKYIGFGRDGDYYPRMLRENVRWSGAMWSTEDNHYLGVHHLIDELQADLVMTACTTDWVFKGYGLEKRHRRLFGKNLPIKQLDADRVHGFLPNVPTAAPADYRDTVTARMDNWFRGMPTELKSDLDHLRVEDRRIRPACYTVSVSGQIMYRTFPYDTFLADSRVAECYGRIPAAWKVNGRIWGLAAGRVCAKAIDIVDANFGWSVNAGIPQRLASFARGWVERRLPRSQGPEQAAVANGHPPCTASWPEYGWYAQHSPTLQQFWETTPAAHRDLLQSLAGEDPWSRPLSAWAVDPNRLFRMLTLLAHWRQGALD